jgi:branched-subunit amino acid aminotransferase/4-amino-4-deoxychorismate lyase
LLRTVTGSIADTSVANVLMITSEDEWVSPSPDSVMIGTSLRWCESILAETNTPIAFRDISIEELKNAREVLLVGNTACVWHASELDGSPIGDGVAGERCRWLQQSWIQRCGFDWLSQGIDGDHRTE